MKNQKAVTMVEAVIIVPVVLTIIFGLIYFGLISVMNGIAESAAHRALDLAISLPELETIPSPLPVCSQTSICEEITEDSNSIDDDFCRGICKVKNEAKALPGNSFFKNSANGSYLAYFSDDKEPVTINIQEESYSKDMSSSQAYNEKPIIIEINYKVKSLLPFGKTLSKKAVASGYREVQSSFSFPIKVDCLGEPFDSPNYNPSKCQCKEKAPGVWGMNWGYYKGTHGEDLCRECPYPSIPYFGDENYDFYHQDQNACSQITGHPDGYACPVKGCWCPTTQKCIEIMGQGGVQMNSDWYQCGCICSDFHGFAKVGQQCKCEDLAADTVYPGSAGKSVTFSKTKTVINLKYGPTCACRIIKDPDGNTIAPRALTDADCDALFPNAAGKLIADLNGCQCRCGYGDDYNSSFAAQGEAGRRGCNFGIYGTTWPADAYNPGGTCSCACINPAMSSNGVQPCACTQSTPNAQLCGSKILANAKINSSTCECECDPSKCVNGEQNKTDCSCNCTWGGSPPNCNAEYGQGE